MTEGEVLGFGGFIVTNLVGISWFARGVQKDVLETKNELRDLRKELKENQHDGSDLSKELKYRVDSLEEWKINSTGFRDRINNKVNDLVNIITVICVKIGVPFHRRESW